RPGDTATPGFLPSRSQGRGCAARCCPSSPAWLRVATADPASASPARSPGDTPHNRAARACMRPTCHPPELRSGDVSAESLRLQEKNGGENALFPALKTALFVGQVADGAGIRPALSPASLKAPCTVRSGHGRWGDHRPTRSVRQGGATGSGAHEGSSSSACAAWKEGSEYASLQSETPCFAKKLWRLRCMSVSQNLTPS